MNRDEDSRYIPAWLVAHGELRGRWPIVGQRCGELSGCAVDSAIGGVLPIARDSLFLAGQSNRDVHNDTGG
jgi:hypothetical protein